LSRERDENPEPGDGDGIEPVNHPRGLEDGEVAALLGKRSREASHCYPLSDSLLDLVRDPGELLRLPLGELRERLIIGAQGRDHMLFADRSEESLQVAEIGQGGPQLGASLSFGVMGPRWGTLQVEREEEVAEAAKRGVRFRAGVVQEERFAESLVVFPLCGVDAGDRGWGRLLSVRHGGPPSCLARLRVQCPLYSGPLPYMWGDACSPASVRGEALPAMAESPPSS
jgi:hypothetical protein